MQNLLRQKEELRTVNGDIAGSVGQGNEAQGISTTADANEYLTKSLRKNLTTSLL